MPRQYSFYPGFQREGTDNHREEGQETYPAEEHDAGDSCTGY